MPNFPPIWPREDDTGLLVRRNLWRPAVLFGLALVLGRTRDAAALTPERSGTPPSLTDAQVQVEAARLRRLLASEVPGVIIPNAARAASWIGMARSALAASDMLIERPQLAVVVDRNPLVQALCLVVVNSDGPWIAIGGSKVSTGQPGRFDHYITPTGVFEHTELILDFRAEGTFNENHVRGLGLKGFRVWDFGWQWAAKGWRADGEGGDIRLLLHATDPAVLEQRIGRQASSGCVRVPAAMNRFLDRHGVLDAEYEAAAVDDTRFRALLMADRTPTPLAGTALVIVDSSQGHVAAAAGQHRQPR